MSVRAIVRARSRSALSDERPQVGVGPELACEVDGKRQRRLRSRGAMYGPSIAEGPSTLTRCHATTGRCRRARWSAASADYEGQTTQRPKRGNTGMGGRSAARPRAPRPREGAALGEARPAKVSCECRFATRTAQPEPERYSLRWPAGHRRVAYRVSRRPPAKARDAEQLAAPQCGMTSRALLVRPIEHGRC